MANNTLYGPLARRRRPSYGLADPFFGGDLFGALSPRNFMDMLNRSADINTTIGDGKITYDVNLAGFDQSEISLKVDPKTNMLNIDANRESDTGSMQRSYAIYLGEDKIKAENLQTSYRNGLLSVTVSKPELAEDNDTFEIPINSVDTKAVGGNTASALPAESSEEDTRESNQVT